jgi:hypothetical protein
MTRYPAGPAFLMRAAPETSSHHSHPYLSIACCQVF